ncbi:exodeoxyribonuclease VII large subunit, partial [Nitratireductor sp. GCM10026969]|uniref:exodeoxyribonuclease VII large subunit n=1 Tax=Nitratireductor sp. GCM10026969 TaxID=3252645 RepID=UPI00360DCB8E
KSRMASDQAARLARSLSYEGVLERGFALVRDAEDKPLKQAAELKKGQELRLQFSDGSAGAIATGKPANPARSKAPAAPKEPGKQGSLF